MNGKKDSYLIQIFLVVILISASIQMLPNEFRFVDEAEAGSSWTQTTELDFQNGTIENKTTGETIEFIPLPDFAIEIVNDGGLLKHIKK